MKCQICNHSSDNLRKLSKHIRDAHKIKIKDYYDNYIKKCTDGLCVICRQETKYVGIGVGYSKTCSQSCSAKLFRKNLKNDEERNKLFLEKVKNNMKREWEKREANGEKKEIINKMKDTKKETVSKMSIEERKQKFGWINKLSDEEKKEKTKELVKPLIDFWENATDEQVSSIFRKRMNTIIEKYGSQFPNYLIEYNEKMDKQLCELFEIDYGKT